MQLAACRLCLQVRGLIAAWVLLTGLMAGCTSLSPVSRADMPPDLPTQVELVYTPFFPDDSHFCGPAALATSLTAAGLNAEPASLVQQVFLPGREGSLQIEMLAGARRQGAVAMTLPNTMTALLRETAAGHPVVVLQNLGLSWAPSWHYAVVIGYDLDEGQIFLRSGPMKRQVMSLRTFEYTWARSDRWAFVTLPPAQLASTVTEAEATRALIAFERSATAQQSAQGYRNALHRWPQSATLAMGLGNALYKAGALRDAEVVFGQTAVALQLAAAYNNQAQVLLELGELPQAHQAVERGLLIAGPFEATLRQTRQALELAATKPQ